MSEFNLQRVFRRVQHLVRSAKTSLAPVETGAVQKVQIAYNPVETGEVNSFQHYGFASSPLPGCDVMIVNVQGDNANGCVIGTNDQRYRPKNMTAGEVRIFNEAGAYIQVKGGEVNIIAPAKVNFTAPEVTMSGKLTVAQDIVSSGGDVKAGTIGLRTHKHTNTQPGSGQSGIPTA